MSDEPRMRVGTLPIVLTFGALLGLYVGAYYGMVYPYQGVALFPATLSLDKNERYWTVETAWRPFFAPVHRLDRVLRPRVWQP